MHLRRTCHLLLLLLTSTFAWAHPEWKQASCVGVVDDGGKFLLTVKFDVPSYLVGKPPKEASLGELDELMLRPERLTKLSQAAPAKFLSEVILLVDGTAVPMELTSFPTAEEVRIQSGKQGEADRYPVLLNAKLEARLPSGCRSLSLRLPPELGSVFANLRKGLEFQVVMSMPAGEAGEFVIREAVAAPDREPLSRRVVGHLTTLFGDGFNHVIPEGWDHCLFMMAMFLGAASLTQALGRSLIFTVGHSITLSLVAFGLLAPVGPWIEPIIALTIGVGGTLAYQGQASSRQLLVLPATFGLVHGLGFAAAAADRLGDWNRSGIVRLLIGFNLGVESAQILVICATAILLACLTRLGLPADRTRRTLGLLVAATGFVILIYRARELLA